MDPKGTLKQSRTLLLKSPAKVNLFLRISHKRQDGYHELRSLMQPVSLYDDIRIGISEGHGIEVACPGSSVPAGGGNIAWRAADLFLKETGAGKRVAIEISKKIPAGAGLGGGSSDAATVLVGLNDALGAPLAETRLMELGACLGSDVPFFILRGPALATGRGEILKKTALPEIHYVLVNPGFEVSTAWVYNNLDLTKRIEDNTLTYSEESPMDFAGIKGVLSNDLEAVTAGKYPEVASIKAALLEAGAAGALMSGSGPTVFGIFPDENGAREAFLRLKGRLNRDYSIFLAEGI